MITLNWRCADRKSVADANAIAFVRSVVEGPRTASYDISNSLVLLGFRAAIARGDLQPSEIVFNLNGRTMEFAVDGGFKDGFPSSPVFHIAERWAAEIMQATCLHNKD